MGGLHIHTIVPIVMLTAASSFARHPFLGKFENFFRKRLFRSAIDYVPQSENK